MVAGWVRAPAVHFLIIGALLFAADRAWQARSAAPAGSARQPIIISARQISEMRAELERKWHAPPSAPQLDGMIQRAIDDELLYREARRLRLDLQDGSVRLRLVQKMRALGDTSQDAEALYQQALRLGLDDDVVVRGILKHKMLLLMQEDPQPAPVSEEAILAYIRAHRERFAQPPTVTFSHVYLSTTVHGTRLDEDAKTMLSRLRAESKPPQAAIEHSDPFPLGSELNGQSRSRLARFFGADFGDKVFEAEPKTWAGPIASSFGLHLVWVSAKTPEQIPPIDAVRRQVASEITEERAQARYAGALRRLRSFYQVRIERSSSATARGASIRGSRS
jgi:parvulin-like peptidyl-prolyl cis-trans isomerase-like protein